MSSQQRKDLKKARKEARLTQKELASKIGITANHYSRIERGKANPSLETLKVLSKILKLGPLDIKSF